MLTGTQIRMARAALRWSADTLAEKVGVAPSTIRRIELSEGTPRALAQTIEAIQAAFENEGVSFVHGQQMGVLIETREDGSDEQTES